MGCSCSGSVAVSTANTDPHPETQGNEHTIAMTDSMPFSVPRGSDEVLQWLNSINLSEYICNFVDNGLNNMCFIETISIDRNLLKEMGITKIGHQHIIMSAIDKLREYNLHIETSPFYQQLMGLSETPCFTMTPYTDMSGDSLTSSWIQSSTSSSNMSDDTFKYWFCDDCNHRNGLLSTQCEICGSGLDAVDGTLIRYLRVSHLRIKCSVIKDDDKWECVKCNNVNGSSDVCLKCGSEYDLNQKHSLDMEATTYIYTKMGVNV
eukprot:245363_1